MILTTIYHLSIGRVIICHIRLCIIECCDTCFDVESQIHCEVLTFYTNKKILTKKTNTTPTQFNCNQIKFIERIKMQLNLKVHLHYTLISSVHNREFSISKDWDKFPHCSSGLVEDKLSTILIYSTNLFWTRKYDFWTNSRKSK